MQEQAINILFGAGSHTSDLSSVWVSCSSGIMIAVVGVDVSVDVP